MGGVSRIKPLPLIVFDNSVVVFIGHEKPWYLSEHMKNIKDHNFVFANDKMEVHTVHGSLRGASGEPFKEEGS